MQEYITVGYKVMQLQDENAALQAEVERLRKAIDAAVHELGVPGENTPAPVSNAYDLLTAALARKGE